MLQMSWINAGEVYYMLAKKHSTAVAEEFLERLPALPLRLVLPDDDQVIAAARLKARYRLSYADAFAAALAQGAGANLMTGDPELRALADLIPIDWIGLD
jgi:predicted nucleic acid-binding protein